MKARLYEEIVSRTGFIFSADIEIAKLFMQLARENS